MRNRKDASQKPLPFDDPPAESPVVESPPTASVDVESCDPAPEALAALDRLEAWLTDPRSGRMNYLGQEAMLALRRSLEEGRKGWIQAAEDALETLALRNGLWEGDDIPGGQHLAAGPDFQETVRELLDCLHGQTLGRSR